MCVLTQAYARGPEAWQLTTERERGQSVLEMQEVRGRHELCPPSPAGSWEPRQVWYADLGFCSLESISSQKQAKWDHYPSKRLSPSTELSLFHLTAGKTDT